MDNKRVLFISAPIGAGHIRAAQAVSQRLSQDYGCQSELCNIFDFLPPAVGQTVLKTYLKILDTFPQAYGAMYGWGNQSRLALFGRELVSKMLARRMLAYIQKFQPGAIVCTHATPAGLVAWLKRNNLLTVPAAGIVTDFIVHRLWVYQEMDYYFVAHPAMSQFLHSYGIAPASVAVTGIPVNDSFSQPCDKSQLFTKLNLSPNHKTIMIMGGGAGVLPIDEIVKAGNQIDQPLQFITIAGKNQSLYQKLSATAASSKHPVKVLGYIDNVHEYMSIADIFVSKPGGMSAAEALAKGVPLVIFRPIPGQEEANTRFLLDNRAALRADSLAELQDKIIRLLSNDTELACLRQQARLLGRPDAASNIAAILEKNYFPSTRH